MKLTYLASIIFVTTLVSPIMVVKCTEKPPLTRLEDFGSDDTDDFDLDDLDVMAAAIEDVDLEIEPPAWYLMWLQKIVVKTKLLALYLALHAWYTNARTTFFGQPHENK